MKRWTEAYVHIAMRAALKNEGFTLIAGEYPGGSDHELYPLNITDPAVARDQSPDPRRHSVGELIPDIVALRGRVLLIGEAKVDYNEADRQKLEVLVQDRRDHLMLALDRFSERRRITDLFPLSSLVILPTLIFSDRKAAPPVPRDFSYLVLGGGGSRSLWGHLAGLT